MLAITFTLLAVKKPFGQEGGSFYGVTLIPVFVGAAPFLFAVLMQCMFDFDQSPHAKLGFCGFISFVITVIIVLSLAVYRADGYYTDAEMQHQWFTIFLPTFIADIFIVPALLTNIYEHCNR